MKPFRRQIVMETVGGPFGTATTFWVRGRLYVVL